MHGKGGSLYQGRLYPFAQHHCCYLKSITDSTGNDAASLDAGANYSSMPNQEPRPEVNFVLVLRYCSGTANLRSTCMYWRLPPLSHKYLGIAVPGSASYTKASPLPVHFIAVSLPWLLVLLVHALRPIVSQATCATGASWLP